MSGREAKKVRKLVKRHAKEFDPTIFVRAIISLPFKRRLQFCWLILLKKE